MYLISVVNQCKIWALPWSPLSPELSWTAAAAITSGCSSSSYCSYWVSDIMQLIVWVDSKSYNYFLQFPCWLHALSGPTIASIRAIWICRRHSAPPTILPCTWILSLVDRIQSIHVVLVYIDYICIVCVHYIDWIWSNHFTNLYNLFFKSSTKA